MSSISSVSNYANSINSASMQRRNRPDPAQMAEDLFSKLDTKSQGYLEKSDLQSAFDKLSGTASSSVDEIFQKLDENSDGKVTKDEMSSSLKNLADELDSQFNQMRMSGGGGEMPPPPPPEGSDSGFTKDELTSQLSEIGSSDSKRSSLIAKVVDNFEAADTDSDGKVSFQEAMAYDQKSGSASSSSANTASSATLSSSDQAVMKRILELMQAYAGNDSSKDSLLGALSISV